MSDVSASYAENGEPIVEGTDTAKCPACGAEMVFSPKEQKLECPYCGCTKEIDLRTPSREIALSQLYAQKNDEWGEETHVFRCNNCGAKEVIGKTEIAKVCPFCGTTNVTQVEELSGLKPNGIVPFAIEPKQATDNVIKWARKRFFAPRAFKKSVKPEKIKGIYMPAFTFDSDTRTSYTGRLGKYYTRTIRSGGKTKTIRELRYFNISGNFDLRFDDMIVHAGKQITQRDIEKMSPFETQRSNAYSSVFLHGYVAQNGERSGEECWVDAQNMMFAEIKNQILSKYEYDVVDYFAPNTSCFNVTYKYILVPVYVGHCNWKKKVYNFFVNGKNGRVTGKTPVSPLRVSLVVLGALAIVGGIVALALLL